MDKRMVISFKHACFLDKYHLVKSLNVPDSTGENIFLLKPKRMTGTYHDSDYSDKYIKKRLTYPNVLTAENIVEEPNKYILVLNFWYFNMLADLKPKNGLYIHSLSEPFNEEMEISHERMHNWLNYFDLKYIQAHCSGHICGSDLKAQIKRIKPKTLFPIHTEHPEMFQGIAVKNRIVQEGTVYPL
jgi:ribonuclease J